MNKYSDKANYITERLFKSSGVADKNPLPIETIVNVFR